MWRFCLSSSEANSAEVSRKSSKILDQGGALVRSLDSLRGGWFGRGSMRSGGSEGALTAVRVRGSGGALMNGAH